MNRNKSELLHLLHRRRLHLEEVVAAVLLDAVFGVVAPGGGSVLDGHVFFRVVGDEGSDGVLPDADPGDRVLVVEIPALPAQLLEVLLILGPPGAVFQDFRHQRSGVMAPFPGILAAGVILNAAVITGTQRIVIVIGDEPNFVVVPLLLREV